LHQSTTGQVVSRSYEQFPKAKIITVDTRDFPIYRRFGREPLPLIMPK
jgi:hypothetical protein